MKKIITAILALGLLSSFTGQTTSRSEYFLARSKQQRSTATIMAIAGASAVGIGLLIGNREESSFDDAAVGAVVGGIGVLTMLGSIPVFIASGLNKRKAVDVTVGTGRVNLPMPGMASSRKFRSVGLRIAL